MPKIENGGPSISLAKIIRSPEPRRELEDELVKLLSFQLKRLKIDWNPKAFRAALNNPDLPEELLKKLEDFLNIASVLRWSLPETFQEEFDQLIEDIESCNPAFLKSLDASRASGRVSSATVKKRLGL